MKIKNVSVKIIGINGHSLLPDAEMEVNDELANSPALNSCLALGLVKVVEVAKMPEPVKEEIVEEVKPEPKKAKTNKEIVEEIADRVEELPKTTRKKTTTKKEVSE